MAVLRAERERLVCPRGMQALYFVSLSLEQERLFKVDQNLPRVWGEGSLPRMPLEGKVTPGGEAGWSRFQRYPGSAGFVERHWSPHLDIAGSGGWGLEAGGEHPFAPECAKQRERRGRRGMAANGGKGFGGKPAPSGPRPASSPRNPRAALLGLWSCGKLTRRPGAPAPLARLCRLREAGGWGAGGERTGRGAGVASELRCSG